MNFTSNYDIFTHYEIGNIYIANGNIIPEINGFHFCKNPDDCDDYYNSVQTRYVKVQGYGCIVCIVYKNNGCTIVVYKAIKLLEELSSEDMGKLYGTYDYSMD